MPRVSRKTKRGGGRRRRTRRMKGGTNYIPRNNTNPIDENIFVPSRELHRIPSGVMNLNSSSDKNVELKYVRDIDYLDKRITFEVGGELINIKGEIKSLTNEIMKIKEDNKILKRTLASLNIID